MRKIAIQKELEVLVEKVIKEFNLKPYDIEVFDNVEKYNKY